METKAQILLVDDEIYVSELVKERLQPYGISTIGIACEGRELFALLKDRSPDIVLLDLLMDGMGGPETFELLSEKHPDIKVIILGNYKNPSLIRNYISCNASAYLNKNMINSPAEMAHIILEVKRFGYYHKDLPLKSETFTIREIEVIKKLAQDKTSLEIADELNTSKANVDKIRTALYKKTQTKNQTGLVAKIVNLGLQLMQHGKP
jgi:DNA-binding NarL/FixJ family response regulator